MTYKIEDFPGIVIKKSWTKLDVLCAVGTEIFKKEFPDEFEKFESIRNGKKKVKEIPQEKPILIKENMFNNGEGCSYWFEEPDNNERQHVPNFRDQENTKNKRKLDLPGAVQQQSRKNTKRSKKNVPQITNPELPEEFKTSIRELNGGTEFIGEMMLVMEKKLTPSDVKENLKRMLLRRVEQIDFTGLLGENEPSERIAVNIIEPTLVHGVVDLRIWTMTRQYYVLTGRWNDIVKNNDLEEGDKVQLWAFRIGEELWFALYKLPPPESEQD